MPAIAAEQRDTARKHAPATLRNRMPIAVGLASELPAGGTVLEIASGSGEHCAFFAYQFPRLAWQPSDPQAESRASIAAWCDGMKNVHPPLDLDAGADEWPVDRAEAVLAINLIHIAPWSTTLGLFAGAARLLPPTAPLILYGPFLREGVETAPSNLDFDRSLRDRDAAWGLRSVEAVDAVAADTGFTRTRLSALPANNLLLVYRRG